MFLGKPPKTPQIAYKFSRTFNWIPHVGPSARHIIAYGLMVLPAAVKEAGREAPIARFFNGFDGFSCISKAQQVEAEMEKNNETTWEL